jgi:hypothetical protein
MTHGNAYSLLGQCDIHYRKHLFDYLSFLIPTEELSLALELLCSVQQWKDTH